MPKYREVYLEQGKTLADSGSLTIDISPIDPISELVLRFWAKNGATGNKKSPIPRVITKIEVVDGADVVFSMDGRLAHALSYYLSGVLPYLFVAEREDTSQIAYIPLRFGRWLWDPIMALDPSKFKNLQLKITWNLAAVNAIGVTGFVTGSGKLSVVARVMEEIGTPPSHFLMHKDHYSWTTGASGDERIALPTDYPYVMAMVRAYESGVQLSDSLENLKLNIDFDKVIPIDISITDLKGMIVNKYGTVRVDNEYEGDNAEVHQAWLGDVHFLSALAGQSDLIVGTTNIDAGQYALTLVNGAGAAQSDAKAFVMAFGQCPWNCLIVPFGVKEDPATYLQAPEHGDIKLILTQGNAGAEANVVLSQLRAY